MNASHDISSIVRSWVRQEEYESADRVLQIVLSQLDSTPQRRSWWPARRFSKMTNPVRYAIAAAAVLVVALVGYQFLPSNTTNPGTHPTATPGQTALASALPTAAPTLPAEGQVSPGTYRMGSGPTVLVTVPAGWVSGDGELRKNAEEQNEVALFIYRPAVSVFADACQSEGTEEPVGPTVADLLAALEAQENSEVSDPEDVTVAGLPGSRFVISAPAALDTTECSIGSLQIWVDDNGSYLAGLGLGPDGNPATVVVADTPDGRLLLFPAHGAAASAADIAERDAMISSMQLVE